MYICTHVIHYGPQSLHFLMRWLATTGRIYKHVVSLMFWAWFGLKAVPRGQYIYLTTIYLDGLTRIDKEAQSHLKRQDSNLTPNDEGTHALPVNHFIP